VSTSDGVRLAYDDQGAGDAVLLVHGLGLSRTRWRAQVLALVDAGYRAITFDLRGFGESDPPPGRYEMPRLVADLTELTQALGLQPLHLVGHSLGGMICQLFTMENPTAVTSLCLASSTSHQGRRSAVLAQVMVRISEMGFDAFIADPDARAFGERALAEVFPDGAPPLEYFRMRDLERPNISHAHAWATTADFSTKDRLDQIRCPVLILHGRTDPLIPFKVGGWLHEGLPGSRFVPLDGGHSIQVEAAHEFNAALLEFLRGLRGGLGRHSPPIQIEPGV
jgi:pimeloyl-ACP methyl ester carboxylesterase